MIAFVANTGGLLGLCMGFSLVSLFEIFYHILGAMAKWWKTIPKRRRLSQQPTDCELSPKHQQQQQQQIFPPVEVIQMELARNTVQCGCNCQMTQRKISKNGLNGQNSVHKSPSVNIGSIHSCERLL